jgi:hypothetical protein
MKRFIVSNDQKGAVLLVTMMILLILTVFGVAAISTTTSEIRIAANAKAQSGGFYGADGGGRTYVPILIAAIDNRVLPVGPPVMDSHLVDELMGMTVAAPDDGISDSPTFHPDLSLTAGSVAVGVDIDRIDQQLLSGGASEFASGYEGIGASSSSGGIGIYYKIDSVGKVGSSQSQVSHTYIYHVR